jgi:hypothetical protein
MPGTSSDAPPTWLMRHWWQIIGALLLVGATWRGTEFEIAGKADQHAVDALADRVQRIEPIAARQPVTDSLLREILHEQRALRTEFSSVRHLICTPTGSADSWCRR